MKIQMLENSIRVKVVVVISLLLGIALGILAFTSYTNAKKAVVSASEQNFVALAGSHANDVSMWLEARRAETETVANAPVVVSGNQEDVLAYLKSEQRRSGIYESFMLADREANYYSTDNTTGTIADQDYFQQVLSSGNTVVSDPLVSKTSGQSILVVAAPVLSGNQITGVLVGSLLTQEMAQIVTSVSVGKSGYAYLLQQDGLCIAHNDQSLAMKTNFLQDGGQHSSVAEAARKMTAGETGFSRYTVNDVKELVGYAPVKGTTWSVAVSIPVSEAVSALGSMLAVNIIVTLLIIVATAFVVSFVVKKFVEPVTVLRVELKKLSQGDGDLTREIPVVSDDELGDLARTGNAFLASLRTILVDVRKASVQVADTSQQLNTNAQQTAIGASETATAMGEIAATVDQLSVNAQKVAEASETTSQFATDGEQVIAHIVEQMDIVAASARSVAVIIDSLSHKSQGIHQIIELITNIADQTNLLALNAAIEAARAGEQGLGFAVVAEEVRKLAEKSTGATKEISNLVSAIQNEAEKAVEGMNEAGVVVAAGTDAVKEAGESFGNIITAVQGLSSEIHSIAASTEQMSSGVQNVAASTEEQTASMEEVSASAEALSRLSNDLDAIVNKFKV